MAISTENDMLRSFAESIPIFELSCFIKPGVEKTEILSDDKFSTDRVYLLEISLRPRESKAKPLLIESMQLIVNVEKKILSLNYAKYSYVTLTQFSSFNLGTFEKCF